MQLRFSSSMLNISNELSLQCSTVGGAQGKCGYGKWEIQVRYTSVRTVQKFVLPLLAIAILQVGLRAGAQPMRLLSACIVCQEWNFLSGRFPHIVRMLCLCLVAYLI